MLRPFFGALDISSWAPQRQLLALLLTNEWLRDELVE